MSSSFPDEDVLDYIFSLLESNRDRNTASLVCKYWYKVESSGRKKVVIQNCYALSPLRLISRFPKVRALTLKGCPHLNDSDSISKVWGGFAYPWIEVIAEKYPSLEELKFKRMVVTDETLELIYRSFPNLKSLVCNHCVGFRTNGIAAIAANCRFLEVLDLEGTAVESVYSFSFLPEISVDTHEWLNFFPRDFTSLVSLNSGRFIGDVGVAALEKLVGRCPNLKSLSLSQPVSLGTFVNILVQAPQLVDLEIGPIIVDSHPPETYINLYRAALNSKLVCKLSGYCRYFAECLPGIIPICSNLIFLNLSTSHGMQPPAFSMLISECRKLQRLWISDSICDDELKVVASMCKELQELRICANSISIRENSFPSEKGLISISIGCPKLHSLQYFCMGMTNAALVTVATNCPNLTRFSLSTTYGAPDHITRQPFDEGYEAIVRSCKKLKHLSLSGLITNQVLLYIGMYAEQLETLTFEFSRQSDIGILYLLNGCSKLMKLVIMNSRIGDAALLAAADKYERLQFFLLSSCNVTLEGCKALAKKVPKLNIEISKDTPFFDDGDVKMMYKIYIYRSLDGPRNDAPGYVCTLG